MPLNYIMLTITDIMPPLITSLDNIPRDLFLTANLMPLSLIKLIVNPITMKKR
jgi:hypothetical protein